VTKNLYVGNLNYDTTENTLRTLFSEFGEIESAKVITDQYTGRSRGFGFVEMGTEEAAQAAISALNGKEVDGRQIRVDKAKPRRSRDRSRSDWGGSRW
jgi:RNA recognition motif-containing protein